MLPVRVLLDRLIMVYKNVSMEQWDDFITKLQANQMFYPKTIVKLGMSSGESAYRYNLNFGFGEGGIRVDYRHNMLKHGEDKACDMRIEFNPQKLHYLDHEWESKDRTHQEIKKQAEPAPLFFRILNDVMSRKGSKNPITGEWSGNVRTIREMDIAFDFAIQPDKMIVMPLTGKEHNYFRGTHYWGRKHTHGYSKKYDKKKEREQNKKKKDSKPDRFVDKYEHLTRFEYTVRMDQDEGINELSRIKEFDFNNHFQIVIMDDDKMKKLDPTVKAYLLCYLNNLMDFKEFSRRYKEKTKNALADLSVVNLNKIVEGHVWKQTILNSITKYIRN